MFAAGVFTANDAIVEAFEAWHQVPVDPALLDRPAPELMPLHPGMTSVTQVLPDKVRDYMVKRFQAAGLDDDTWAERWRAAEDRLLDRNPRDAFDVVEVIEDLGREVFAQHLSDAGLLVDKLPPLKPALAGRYFLMPATDRTTAFESMVETLEASTEPLLAPTLMILRSEKMLGGLSSKQQKELALFLLDLHQAFLHEYPDFAGAEAPLMKMLSDKSSDFEKEMGFALPSAENIVSFLKLARTRLGKR